MKSFNLETNYYVHSLSSHKEIKEVLLKSIEKFTTNNSLVGNNQNISNTDWNIDSSVKREWFDIFMKNNEKEIYDIYNFIYEDFRKISGKDININIDNWWFQQYEKDSYHGWHNHIASTFSNVYYLELPDPSETTEIFSGKNKSSLINAKEGDLVIFPAFMPHKALNSSDRRRTTLVFNTTIPI